MGGGRRVGSAVRRWGRRAARDRNRLAKKGMGFWVPQNDLLQGYALTLVIAAGLIWAFAWIALPFILLHHFVGWLQLTFANYVEHYGLLRGKRWKINAGQRCAWVRRYNSFGYTGIYIG